jgi:hypothetical protein
LLAAAIVVGLPQVLLLRSGNAMTYRLFNPGYTLENLSLWLLVKYLGWTFGVKWILLAVALVFTTGFQRKLLLAFTSLVAIVFLFQLSVDVFNNHKLLNIWATCVNVYAAYALWQIGKQKIIGPILAVLLAIVTVFGGIVDLFPLHNDPMLAGAVQERSAQSVAANEHAAVRHFSDAHTADPSDSIYRTQSLSWLHALRVDRGLQRSGPRSGVSRDVSGK